MNVDVKDYIVETEMKTLKFHFNMLFLVTHYF